MSAPSCTVPGRAAARWPLERVLFALAGTMTLLSAALAALVSPWFLLLTAFVGVNQWLYVLVGACPASLVLRRVFALRSAVYPARRGPLVSADRSSAPRGCVPGGRAPDGVGPHRSPRSLDRHAFPRGARGLARDRAGPRLLRPQSREGAVRRRLGSERVAVDAGSQAGRTRLRRPRRLRADDGRLLAARNRVRPRLQGRRRPRRRRRCARAPLSASWLPRGRACRSRPTGTRRSSRAAPPGTPTRWSRRPTSSRASSTPSRPATRSSTSRARPGCGRTSTPPTARRCSSRRSSPGR